MNSVALGIGVVAYSGRKTIAVMLITVVMILSLPMIAVASMGTSALSFLASSPNAKAAESKGFYMGEMVPGNTYDWGNCTYWAYAMRMWAGNPIGKWWGNANKWDESARNEDYVVNHTPAIGAIFQTDEGEWGHVAYVIKVDSATGEWTISEMNAPNINVVTQRTFTKESAGYYTFIHDKKGAPTWIPQPISNSSLPIGN